MANPLTPAQQQEIEQLAKQATHLTWYLLGVILLFLVVSVLLGTYGPTMANAPWWGIVLSIAAGTVGSGVAAVQSAQQRRANGWEVNDGTKYPEDKPEDKFTEGMLPLFYTRPFLGSVVGAVFYFGAPSVFGLGASVHENPEQLAFWSFVVGVLAKTFLETLKDLFKKLGK